MKQIFPPTILGHSFAPGGSVLEHNFGASDPYTLGVEEEYMLLDGDASLQPLRAPADHGARSLPASRRPTPVRGAARADLRAAHPRRGRRLRARDPGRERAADPPLVAARAFGELPVLAWRADGPRVQPPDGVRRLPTLRPSAPLPRLRRLRRSCRSAREDRMHRGLHAHLVGHPPAP